MYKNKKGFTRSSTSSSSRNEKASREVVVGGADTAPSKTTPLPFASKRRDGFTLIEMLIVIAIIGILASILLVGLGTFRGRGRDARRISDLRQVQNALELYFNQQGRYPLTSEISKWGDLRSKLTGAGIGVSTIANDPTVGKEYGYCSIDGTKYVLGAVLEDAGNPVLKDQENTTFSCAPVTAPSPGCHSSSNDSAGYCITL